MSLSRNLLAGLANSIWTALIGLAVVPLYLKYLGIEAYGLIGFFTTTQALLSLLDMGLAPTINREVARCSTSGNMKEARTLLHTLAVVYVSVAAFIALAVFALAPLIASHWLRANQLNPETLKHAVMLMGLVIACRWPIGLYQGALMGMQRHTVSSMVSMLMVTVGNLGAVAILAFVSPTIEAFFIWQAGVAVANAAVIRFAAWRVIEAGDKAKFDKSAIQKVWKFSASMSGVSVAAIILTQLDKVLLSNMLSLQDFGRYALAGIVASGLSILIAPTFNTIYPRLSALANKVEEAELFSLYLLITRFFSALIIPIALAMAFYAEELLYVWTSNLTLAIEVTPIVRLLVLGTALNGIMHLPFALQLAFGMTRLPLILAMSLMIIFVPLIIFLTGTYGAIGGAIAWLVLNIIYLLWGTWLTHRHLLKGFGARWLTAGVAVPAIVSILIMVVSQEWIQSQTDWTKLSKLIMGSFSAFLACLVNFGISTQLRNVIWQKRYLLRAKGKTT